MDTDLLVLEALDLAASALLVEAAGPVGIGGIDPRALARLLRDAERAGRTVLVTLARAATTRYLRHGLLPGQRFLSDAELVELAQALMQAVEAGDLLARSLVRELAQGEPFPAPAPETPAAELLRRLTPSLGPNPLRRAGDLRRRAFGLAITTDTEIARRVRDGIADVLASGEVTRGRNVVQAVLDSAGLSQASPHYAETVFRTNAISAYNDAAQDELSSLSDAFPVWKYSNPDDVRSRPHHAEKSGRYYPSSIPFVRVRGESPADVFNCRCTFIPISKRQWKRLKTAGARIADGYPDVPAIS